MWTRGITEQSQQTELGKRLRLPGASFWLQDGLRLCSDASTTAACTQYFGGCILTLTASVADSLTCAWLHVLETEDLLRHGSEPAFLWRATRDPRVARHLRVPEGGGLAKADGALALVTSGEPRTSFSLAVLNGSLTGSSASFTVSAIPCAIPGCHEYAPTSTAGLVLCTRVERSASVFL